MMDKVKKLGGKAYYLSCDLTDETAVRKAVQKIIKTEGRVDVLLHAAGLERSRKLENKPTEEFRRSYR